MGHDWRILSKGLTKLIYGFFFEIFYGGKQTYNSTILTILAYTVQYC